MSSEAPPKNGDPVFQRTPRAGLNTSLPNVPRPWSGNVTAPGSAASERAPLRRTHTGLSMSPKAPGTEGDLRKTNSSAALMRLSEKKLPHPPQGRPEPIKKQPTVLDILKNSMEEDGRVIFPRRGSTGKATTINTTEDNPLPSHLKSVGSHEQINTQKRLRPLLMLPSRPGTRQTEGMDVPEVSSNKKHTIWLTILSVLLVICCALLVVGIVTDAFGTSKSPQTSLNVSLEDLENGTLVVGSLIAKDSGALGGNVTLGRNPVDFVDVAGRLVVRGTTSLGKATFAEDELEVEGNILAEGTAKAEQFNATRALVVDEIYQTMYGKSGIVADNAPSFEFSSQGHVSISLERGGKTRIDSPDSVQIGARDASSVIIGGPQSFVHRILGDQLQVGRGNGTSSLTPPDSTIATSSPFHIRGQKALRTARRTTLSTAEGGDLLIDGGEGSNGVPTSGNVLIGTESKHTEIGNAAGNVTVRAQTTLLDATFARIASNDSSVTISEQSLDLAADSIALEGITVSIGLEQGSTHLHSSEVTIGSDASEFILERPQATVTNGSNTVFRGQDTAAEKGGDVIIETGVGQHSNGSLWLGTSAPHVYIGGETSSVTIGSNFQDSDGSLRMGSSADHVYIGRETSDVTIGSSFQDANGTVSLGTSADRVRIGQETSDVTIGSSFQDANGTVSLGTSADRVRIGQETSDVTIGSGFQDANGTVSLGTSAGRVYIGNETSEVTIGSALHMFNEENRTTVRLDHAFLVNVSGVLETTGLQSIIRGADLASVVSDAHVNITAPRITIDGDDISIDSSANLRVESNTMEVDSGTGPMSLTGSGVSINSPTGTIFLSGPVINVTSGSELLLSGNVTRVGHESVRTVVGSAAGETIIQGSEITFSDDLEQLTIGELMRISRNGTSVEVNAVRDEDVLSIGASKGTVDLIAGIRLTKTNQNVSVTAINPSHPIHIGQDADSTVTVSALQISSDTDTVSADTIDARQLRLGDSSSNVTINGLLVIHEENDMVVLQPTQDQDRSMRIGWETDSFVGIGALHITTRSGSVTADTVDSLQLNIGESSANVSINDALLIHKENSTVILESVRDEDTSMVVGRGIHEMDIADIFQLSNLQTQMDHVLELEVYDSHALLTLNRDEQSNETPTLNIQGAQGVGAQDGGDVLIDAGVGEGASVAGTIQIGEFASSVTLKVQNTSALSFTKDASGVIRALVGSDNGNLLISRPDSEAGTAFQTTISGQKTTHLSGVGGDVHIEAGFGRSANGIVYVGYNNTDAVHLGSTNEESLVVESSSLLFSGENSELILSAEAAVSGNGTTLQVLGQDGDQRGGDLELDAGTGSSTNGTVRIGATNAGEVIIGQSTARVSIVGQSVSISESMTIEDITFDPVDATTLSVDADSMLLGSQQSTGISLSVPAKTSVGTAASFRIVGQDTSQVTGLAGGDIYIDGGSGNTTNGKVYVGVDSTSEIVIGSPNTVVRFESDVQLEGEVRLGDPVIEFGPYDGNVTLTRPTAVGTEGHATILLGQEASNAGGDVYIRGGEGGAQGGAVYVGDESTTAVHIGSEHADVSISSTIMSFASDATNPEFTISDTLANGTTLRITGQSSTGANTVGGNIVIDAGDGTTSGSVTLAATSPLYLGSGSEATMLRSKEIFVGDGTGDCIVRPVETVTSPTAFVLQGQPGGSAVDDGGDLVLRGGQRGDVAAEHGDVVIGDTETGMLLIGSAGGTSVHIKGEEITIGDASAATLLKKQDTEDGTNGSSFEVRGQSAPVTASVATNGGSLLLSSGTGAAGGTSGSVQIVAAGAEVEIGSTSPVVRLGQGSGTVKILSEDVHVGPGDSPVSLTQANAEVGDATNTLTVIGQSVHDSEVGPSSGGNLILDGGAGTSLELNGAVIIGSASGQVEIGKSSADTFLRSTTTYFGSDSGDSYLARTTVPGLNVDGGRTHIRGQDVNSQSSIDVDGGDLIIDAGAGALGGSSGTIYIGNNTDTVYVGSLTGKTYLRTTDIHLCLPSGPCTIQRSPSEDGNGLDTTFKGQDAADGITSRDGGPLYIDGGDGTNGGVQGEVVIGSSSNFVSIGTSQGDVNIFGSELFVGDATGSLTLQRPSSLIGNGQSTTIKGQDAQDGVGNRNGGDLTLNAGGGAGTGSAGNVYVGTSSASLTLGPTGKLVHLRGAVISVGDSSSSIVLKPPVSSGATGNQMRIEGQDSDNTVASDTTGGDLVLNGGSGSGTGLDGRVLIGDDDSSAVLLGKSGQRRVYILGTRLYVGDSDSAFTLSPPESTSSGNDMFIRGQNAESGSAVAADGGDLYLDGGYGSSGGAAGVLYLGTDSSGIVIGDSSTELAFPSSTVHYGTAGGGPVSVGVPSTANGAGTRLNIAAGSGTVGGDLTLDGGSGTLTDGVVYLGTSSKAVHISQSSGEVYFNAPVIYLGDTAQSLLMTRNAPASGNGHDTTISGQSGESGAVSADGGNLILDAGAGSGAGTAGNVVIGGSSSSVIVGAPSNGAVLLGSSLEVGDDNADFTFSRPESADGTGYTTRIIGQNGLSSGNNDGGDTYVDGGSGSGTGTDGDLYLGTQSDDTIIGQSSGSVEIRSAELVVGSASASLTISRPSISSGSGKATILLGQSATGSGDADGGLVRIDGGLGKGTGNAGEVHIGTQSAGVYIGSSASTQYILGSRIELGGGSQAVVLSRPESSASSGSSTSLVGQAAEAVSNGDGGNLLLDGGAGAGTGTSGSVYLGTQSESVTIGQSGTTIRLQGSTYEIGDDTSSLSFSRPENAVGSGTTMTIVGQDAFSGGGNFPGGDLSLDGGSGAGTGNAGSVLVGTNSHSLVLGKPASTHYLRGSEVEFGDATTAFSFSRPSSTTGAGSSTYITGQAAGTGGGSNEDGGDLHVDGGDGLGSGAAGAVYIGASSSSVYIGNGDADISLTATTLTLGAASSSLSLVRPQSSGIGRDTSLLGQQGASGQQGGDLILKGGESGGGNADGGDVHINGGPGSGTGTSGVVYAGDASSAVEIGGSVTSYIQLKASSTLVGSSSGEGTIGRPAVSAGSGLSLNIVGQGGASGEAGGLVRITGGSAGAGGADATGGGVAIQGGRGAGDGNGGDVHVNGGDASGNGDAGSVYIGDTSKSVVIGDGSNAVNILGNVEITGTLSRGSGDTPSVAMAFSDTLTYDPINDLQPHDQFRISHTIADITKIMSVSWTAYVASPGAADVTDFDGYFDVPYTFPMMFFGTGYGSDSFSRPPFSILAVDSTSFICQASMENIFATTFEFKILVTLDVS